MNKRLIALLAIFAIVTLPFSGLITKVNAAGVALSVVPSSQVISSSAALTLSFTPGSVLASGSTITVAFPSGYTQTPGVLTTADVVVTKTGDAGFTSAALGSISTTGFVLTLTTSANLNTTSAFSIAFNGGTNKLQTPASAGNYAFSVVTSAGDQGAVLQYVGNANQVNVTANVGPVLSLNLRNAGDTADLAPGTTAGARICNMGALTINTTPTGGVTNECQYRIRISTNSQSGFTAQYTSVSAAAGKFAANATTTIVDATAGTTTGDPLSTNIGYGVQMTEGTGLTRGGTFGGAASANFYTITSTTPTTVLSTTGLYTPNASPDTTKTTLMTHGARIDGTQGAGLYSHTITYTVTASF